MEQVSNPVVIPLEPLRLTQPYTLEGSGKTRNDIQLLCKNAGQEKMINGASQLCHCLPDTTDQHRAQHSNSSMGKIFTFHILR